MTGLATASDTPSTARDAIRTFYRHTSPRLLTAGAIVALGARVAAGAWSWVDLVVPAVLLAVWPLNEWLIHVFILHFRPRQVLGRRVDLLNAREHRKHHADPWRVAQVFVPLPTVLTGLVAIPALAWALLPHPVWLTAVAAYMVLSAHYEWVHYLCHIRWCPDVAHYKRLVTAHRLHHFKSERHWLGVSMTSADAWLGTAPDPRTLPTSSTVRTLGIEADGG